MNLKKIKSNKKSLKLISKTYGVYLFTENNKYIYIGKANSLRDRLSSYFSISTSGKVKEIVKRSDSISYIEVNSEIEALLLEAKLVGKYKPYYNSSLKDDKSPLYIIITNDIYPQVKSIRKSNLKIAKYIHGPFPNASYVKEILKILRRIFPFSQHNIGKRACLYNHINLCDPCPNLIENIKDKTIKKALFDEYQKNITYINGILSGRFKFVTNELRRDMYKKSKMKDYEGALELKKKLDIFDYITKPNTDIKEVLKNPNFAEDIRKKEVTELLRMLKDNKLIINNINRIECFDVSHLSGFYTTASMVTFINGKAEKSLYRHFRIRSKNKSNDLTSLNEVINRRLKHINTWGQPDLIIVDGGKTQVKTFYEILKERNISVVGLAKRNETLIIPMLLDDELSYIEYRVSKGNARNLLQRIRNESHRFAISYHKKLLSKSYYV